MNKKNIGKHKKLVLLVVGILTISSIAIAGFIGKVSFHGVVATAKVDFNIKEYSGTWVYKDMVTDDCVVLNHISDNPEYLYVASGTAAPGSNEYDVDFVFDNIFPCIFFKADFIAEYTGSIPVHLNGMVFTADQWLIPFIFWNAYECSMVNSEYVKGSLVPVGYQLHNGMLLWVDVIVKLPQDNSLQDLNGMFSGSLDVIQWNDFCDKTLDLPADDVSMLCLKNTPGSYFNVTLSDVPVGYDVSNGYYRGWCVDQSTNMLLDTVISCHLYDEYNLYPDPDWDMVNYIINHKNSSASKADVQAAIWYFIDGGVYPVDPEAVSMVVDALACGEGFVPGSGEWVAVLVDNMYQKIFIEVDP